MEGCSENDSCCAGAVEGRELLDQWSVLLLLTTECTVLRFIFVSNDFVSFNGLLCKQELFSFLCYNKVRHTVHDEQSHQ